MINNFLCDKCSHYQVCEKLKSLMKFHDSAKKDLLITLTMEDCLDYNDENGEDKSADTPDDDDEEE